MAPGPAQSRDDHHNMSAPPPHGRHEPPQTGPAPPPAAAPTPAPAQAQAPASPPPPPPAGQAPAPGPPPPPQSQPISTSSPPPTSTFESQVSAITSTTSTISQHTKSRATKSITTTLTVTPSASTAPLLSQYQENSSAAGKGPPYALLVALPLTIILFFGIAICSLAIFYRRRKQRRIAQQAEGQTQKQDHKRDSTKSSIASSLRSSLRSSLKSSRQKLGPNSGRISTSSESVYSEKSQVQRLELASTNSPPQPPYRMSVERPQTYQARPTPPGLQISSRPQSPHELQAGQRLQTFGPPLSPPPRGPPPRPPRPLGEWLPAGLRIGERPQGTGTGTGNTSTSF